MKKKIASLFLVTSISLIAALPSFAANESNVTAIPSSNVSSVPIAPRVEGQYTTVTSSPSNFAMSSAVDGAGKYGKITLSSTGEASLYVYYNNGDGVWRIWTINDPGAGFIFLPSSGGSSSLAFYMNLGWKYKVEVGAKSNEATGYIRNYN